MDMTSTVTIKGYELREQIGAGGFGVVYRAYQPTIGREVAIKVVLPGLANQLDFIRRFENEAQLVARLEHPHVTPLYDYWRDPEGAYLVMRWLRGGSLRDALQQGAFELNAAALLLEQIAGALSVAHRSNIIHRDIKPGNILLDEDGNAYLTDFGIAKDLNLPGSHTQPDSILGSLDYISPEQARSEPITARTDIYSLGVTLFEMITGQHPFPSLTAVERLYKHINDPLPEIAALGTPENTSAINQVIQKATAKNPQHRYPDALAFAADFRAAVALGHTPVSLIELLTQREHEILHLIMEGASNKEIAQRLTVTLSTVKWYINQIYTKLGVRSRVQAIVRARELNLLVKQEGTTVIGVVPTSDFRPANPYKGLQAFQSADNQVFFGREGATARLLERLAETGDSRRFLAVVGPSGSGKSSLVKAGLIPALWRGDLPGSEKWFIVEMLPGARPLDALEIALTKVAANQSKNLRDHLARDAHGLVRVADLILPNDNSDLVLMIDQFEELFTLVVDEAERRHFLDLLVTAVTAPRTRVRLIVTLRADFYDRPLHYPEFAVLLQKRLETILPLSANELEHAIVKPAEQAGMTFEPGLVTRIVADVNYQPGALPLLQYALTELFERRQGRQLTQAAYHEIGGAVGALAKRAEQTYTEMTREDQEIARQMFLRLVTLGEGTEDTRRRVPRVELLSLADDREAVDELIDTFVAYRLLSLDNENGSRIPTVEVAHEALLREWKQLRQWISENREEIKMQQQLAHLTEEWVTGGKDTSYLVGGLRLEQFETWAKGAQLALTPDERLYLSASIAHRQAENQAEIERKAREASLERRSQTFLRGLVAVLVVAVIGAFGLTAVAANQRQIALSWLDTAQLERERAETQSRISTARELTGYATANLASDAELSTLLALQAVNTTYRVDSTILPEAETVLHQAVQGLRSPVRIEAADYPSGWSLPAFFTQDGRRVIYPLLIHPVDGKDERTAISDAATGQVLYTVDGEPIADFTVDDRLITFNGIESGFVLNVWDISSSSGAQVLRTIPAPVALDFELVDVTSDLHYFTTQSVSRGAEIFDLTSGTEIAVPSFEAAPAASASFSPDGEWLAFRNNDSSLSLIDTSTWLVAKTFSPNGTTVGTANQWLRFSLDGEMVATTNTNDTISVWNVATGDEHVFVADFRPEIVTLNADGTRLMAGTLDGNIIIWDTTTGQDVLRFSGGAIERANFSPDSTRLVTLHRGELKLWDLQPSNEIITLVNSGIDPENGAMGLAYDPDGTRVIVASVDETPSVWDVTTGQELFTLEGHTARVLTTAWSPDGTQIATAGEDTTARIWDASTGELIYTLSGHEDPIYSVAFSPDSTRVATSSLDGTIRIWNSATGELSLALEQPGPSKGVAWSPDGTKIAAGTNPVNGEGHLVIWDSTTGEQTLDITLGNTRIGTVAFSPDGGQIVVGLLEGQRAEVWDTETSQLVWTLSGNTDLVAGVAYNPDGTRIATASADGTIRLWNTVDGQELFTLYGSSEGAVRVAFNPDGTRLATQNSDGTTRIFFVAIDDLIALAESRLTRTLTEAECQRYLHVETCPVQAS